MNTYLPQRLARLRDVMAAQSVPALCIFSLHSLRYLAGYSGEAACGIVTADRAYLITDYRFIEQAEQECSGWTCLCRDRDRQTLGEMMADTLQQSGISRAAFEAEQVSVGMWQQIQMATSAIQWQAAPDWIGQLRKTKDPWEIAQIQQAADIADAALAQVLPLIKLGVTEHDIALELDYRMQKLGAEALSFATILGFGARSALPHCIPSQTRLQAGDLVVLDFGAVINGYRSDMTRSFVAGTPDATQRRMYQAVTDAQQAAFAVLRSGILASEADATARHVLAAYGYANIAGSSLGHGVGLQLHEQPIMGPNCHEPLLSNYVVTIEPGIYLPQYGGIRIEDDVIITATGYQCINHAPKQFELNV